MYEFFVKIDMVGAILGNSPRNHLITSLPQCPDRTEMYIPLLQWFSQVLAARIAGMVYWASGLSGWSSN